ncbi:MAG: 50S ribosomal protein L17 [Crocinitomicaceae bacterium]|nr:50S ribosomal protein L17 [Crocinitomicaceae bacterium]
MRHGKKFNHLGRKKAHREAMLRNMACSLIEHKRIKTTVAKAKALRMFVEPLITKSKTDVMHSRRTVFSSLHNKHAVTELFREVAPKVSDRKGGYTRIIKIGNRLGDNAEMCYIELVDFNELMLADAKPAGKKAKRSRRGGGAKKATGDVAVSAVADAVEVAEEAAPAEEVEAVAEEAAPAEEVEAVAEEAAPTEEVEAVAEEAAPAEEVEAVAEEAAPAEEVEAIAEEAAPAEEADSTEDEEKGNEEQEGSEETKSEE